MARHWSSCPTCGTEFTNESAKVFVEGFYHVKLRGEWTIGQYHVDHCHPWQVIGETVRFGGHDITEVGDKITR